MKLYISHKILVLLTLQKIKLIDILGNISNKGVITAPAKYNLAYKRSEQTAI